MRCSGRTLRNGDCRSCTSSASFNVSSNTGSPVLLAKSAITTASRSVNARGRLEYTSTPAIATAATAAPVAAVFQPTRRAAGGAARGRHRHARRFARPPQPLEIAAQIGRRLIPEVAILLERLRDDPIELRRHRRVHARGRRGLARQQRLERRDRRGAGERQRPGRHLVQHDAEREDVGARVQFVAPRLLRRHVRHGPQRGADRRHVLGRDARDIGVGAPPRRDIASLAMPKSSTLAWPRSVTKIFAGLISR